MFMGAKLWKKQQHEQCQRRIIHHATEIWWKRHHSNNPVVQFLDDRRTDFGQADGQRDCGSPRHRRRLMGLKAVAEVSLLCQLWKGGALGLSHVEVYCPQYFAIINVSSDIGRSRRRE